MKCGGYATIECYLKLTSPGSGLSCLPCLLMVVEEVSETWKWKRLIEFMSTTLDLEDKGFLL